MMEIKVTARLEKILFVSVVCALVVPFGACTLSTDSNATAEESVAAPDMNAFWAAHVADRKSGDIDAVTRILAEDCVLHEPFQAPISGKDNIKPKLKEAMAMTVTHALSFESREVYREGESLVDIGTFSETFSLAGKEDERNLIEGSYVAVLETSDAGEWKVNRFMVIPSTEMSP